MQLVREAESEPKDRRACLSLQFSDEVANSLIDVVSDEAHPFDAVDAALGRLVGKPALERTCRVGRHLQLRFLANDHHAVSCSQNIGVDGFRLPRRHVGSCFSDHVDRQLVEGGTGLSSGGEHLEFPLRVLAGKGSRHLGLSAVADAHEQDLGNRLHS